MSSDVKVPPVKLVLRLRDFSEEAWLGDLAVSERAGIRFRSFAELGDSEENRRRLYALNKECSADIPGRGPFYSFEEYRQQRLEVEQFLPDGVFLALKDDEWIGMAGISYRKGRDYAFHEMTGVVRSWRRRGVATSVKVLAIRFARSLGVDSIRTVHAAANQAAIAMNRRLGFVDLPDEAD